jgi:crotonobetainyl-CoA:carnitine CoA-transferase CaiB-like acyl-CoA transferase
MDEFEEWSQHRSTLDCLTVLDRHAVPAAAYRTVREAMTDPQLSHRGAFAVVIDAGGEFQALNPPFRMSATLAVAGARAPALGEHTQEVLTAAGLNEEEIKALSHTDNGEIAARGG